MVCRFLALPLEHANLHLPLVLCFWQSTKISRIKIKEHMIIYTSGEDNHEPGDRSKGPESATPSRVLLGTVTVI